MVIARTLLGHLLRVDVLSSLVELLELLRIGSLEGSRAGQTLEDDGPQTPQVCLAIVLLGHDHLGGL